MPANPLHWEDFQSKEDFYRAFCDRHYDHCVRLARCLIRRKRGGSVPRCQGFEHLSIQLASNTLLKLILKHETILEPKAIWGWLKTTMRRELIDHLRKEARYREVFKSLPDYEVVVDVSSGPLDTLYDECIEQLEKELSSLSPRDRRIIVDYYFGQMTRKEILAREGMEYHQVCRVISKFLESMRKIFAREASSSL